MCQPTGGLSEHRNKKHIVIFPFMAKGHVIPLLHLSSALSLRSLKVTLVATEASSPFLQEYLHLPKPNIHVLLLPFPSTPTIPPGCETTDNLPSFDLYFAFHGATRLLDGAFREVLQTMKDSGDLPLCVISDYFLGWTRPICEEEFGVPRLSFSGMGAFAHAICKAAFAKLKSQEPRGKGFELPGAPEQLSLNVRDLPISLQHMDPKDPMFEIVKASDEEELKSWGLVVNEFACLDPVYVEFLQVSFPKGTRAWLLGPLSLYPCDTRATATLRTLPASLDGKPTGSVLLVAFGTQAGLRDDQLDEVARGLVMSGCDFIWVVRSSTWNPTGQMERWLEESKGTVLLREMAPQREVLRHPATGGFLSHCGWNSVMESVSAGVPILAWPMSEFSDQRLNSTYVVDEIGVGVRIHDRDVGVLVSAEEVCRGVKELMEGEGGKKARKKVKFLAEAATAAVGEGGSSEKALDELLTNLHAVL